MPALRLASDVAATCYAEAGMLRYAYMPYVARLLAAATLTDSSLLMTHEWSLA